MTAQCRPYRIAKYPEQIDQRARSQKTAARASRRTRIVIEFLVELIRADSQ